ncbi:MAM and LDL-receptor class A domain-containing protein 1-like isoform X2 [Patiria miniata]|uniref:MAM domain-containing protein n=1 Tax=Patiria miniata TaxID=46514 RepID=A0A914AZT7_PATMI|nr:MAM and LDL-receptor class A domain-containing protein 1-like isoform X2 [Patiria miniata]
MGKTCAVAALVATLLCVTCAAGGANEVIPPEMSETSFLVDCDFDSAIPFCHYTNSKTDDADWYTTSGRLNDDEIGPVADHTTGNYTGTYLYTKTSYSESFESRLEGVTAVAPADGGCVRFWYHMYGSSIGSLKVHTERSGDLGPARWSQSGYTKVSQWYEASISIEPASEFKLVFISESGTGFRGNIAIDDISFVDGQCPVIPPEMPDPSFLVDCDFDSAIRFCHYTNSETDEADWYTISGKLNDDEIGPVADHTTGNYSGTYLYTKTSYSESFESRLEGVTAVAPAEGGCVRFWCHMYGSSIGSLKVHTEKSGDLGPARWSQSGYTKVSQWYEASISIEPASEFKLVFVSESGTGFRGNIAIDDISLAGGPCPVKPPEMPDPSFLVDCDFEGAIPYCHYTNSKTDDAEWYTTSGKLNDDEIGPVADHTTGNYSGTYLYTKTSYSESFESRLEGVTAVAPAEGGCVRFWYHMYGSSIGSLKVHTEASGDLGPARWSQLGYTKVSQWYEASISIEPASEFKLVFVSESGTGFRGNIAIDDISLAGGPCPVKPPEMPDPSFLVDCDFDISAIPLCHYTNSKTDEADWYTISGGLNDDEIGPIADHTTGNYTGTYLYTKTSYSESLESRLEGVTAVAPDDGGCVRFWYHMYGSSIGSLKVHTEASGDLGPARWSQSGYTKVSQWYEASISIDPGEDFKLVFVSQSRVGSVGNIAIDDIGLVSGKC